MSTPAPGGNDVVWMFDCDNTLLDNDGFESDLRTRLVEAFGHADAERFWQGYEQLRGELGFADYLGALQRFRDRSTSDQRLLELSDFVLEYPFGDRLYPGALHVLRHCGTDGATVILSDGDVVLQPRKLRRSGLWEAVDGRVLIYIHKEQMLEQIAERFPAHHYVMVDDKARVLTAMKQAWRSRLTTVFPRQGHYAMDAAAVARYPAPDVTIERIDALLARPPVDWLGATETRSPSA